MWRLRSDLGTAGIFGHAVVWFLLILCTCGLAAFLFPYSLGEKLINSTVLLNEHGQPIGRLRCTMTTGGHIVHAIWWWFLTVITFGIAGLFYLYRCTGDLLGSTVIDRA